MLKLKDLLNERYVSKRSDTIEDVFKSAVEALEDLYRDAVRVGQENPGGLE